ncbi:serine hydrolase domain-containing protein [Lysinibacillus fusiformis]|uniref:serine hydrolase domain-containing protein n=1 Tax=Lysinibacillus fusiformis TaxID=28031 RepID=UPI00381A0E10
MLKSYIHSFLNAKEEKFSGNIVVACQGETIYKESFGKANYEWDIPNTAITKFRIGSVTKIFTAIAILTLVEEKKLQLHNTVADFIPTFPKGNQITIEHLLTHTSGIGNITDQPDFLLKSYQLQSPDDLINWIISCSFKSIPGKEFNYSNSGYIVLGKIIEVISGLSYEEFLKKRIFQPLSMINTGLDANEAIQKHKASGYELDANNNMCHASFINMSNTYSAGGLFSTVEDLQLLDDGIKNYSLLSKNITSQMFSSGLCGYGYGWNIIKTKKNNTLVFHHGGINGFTSSYLRLIEKNMTIMVLSNMSTLLTSTLADEIVTYIENRH